MKKSICAVLFAAAVATNAFGSPVSIASQAVVSEADEYQTIGQIDAMIPRGESVWTLDQEEAMAPGNLSIWHLMEPSCRGFDIVSIRTKTHTDGAEWVALTANVFQSVAHFNALTAFNTLEVTVSNPRILPSSCTILVRQAKFAVPQVVTVLAKVNAPSCDDSDTPVCAYSATRIDSEEREVLVLTKEDFATFKLKAGTVYKFKGYVMGVDGDLSFRLVSSQPIM